MSDHSKDRRSTEAMIDHGWRAFWFTRLKVLAVAAALTVIWFAFDDGQAVIPWLREQMIPSLPMTRWFFVVALTTVTLFLV